MNNRTFKVPEDNTSNSQQAEVIKFHQDLTYQSNSDKEELDMTKVRRCGAGWVYCDGRCGICPATHMTTSNTTTPNPDPSYSNTTQSDPDCEGDWDWEDNDPDDCFCDD